MPLHVDVAQLVDIVLHRPLRERVDQHFFGPVGLMLLVVGVVVGKDGEEHIALHIIVGEGILIVDFGIFA